MVYQKITSQCTDFKQLMDELKTFVLQNTTFVDAGKISDSAYSFKSPDGWYYNFNFGAAIIETTITKHKPSGNISQGMDEYKHEYGTGYSLTRTDNFKYPFVSRHFFTNGKLVAMVIEISSGVYRHHAFGKFDTFGNVAGGEFAGGTVTTRQDIKIYSENVNNYNYANPHYFTHPFVFGWDTSYHNQNYYARNWIRKDDKFIRASGNSQNAYNSVEFCCGYNTPFYGLGGNGYNGRVQLYPIVWNIVTPYKSNVWATYPQIPMYYTDMVALVDIKDLLPEDVVNNDWVVFPLVSKSENLKQDVGTTSYGVAYKK